MAVDEVSQAEQNRGNMPGERRGLRAICLTAELFGSGRLGRMAFGDSCGWDLRGADVEAEAADELADQKPFLIETPGPCELPAAVRLARVQFERGDYLILGCFRISRGLKKYALRTGVFGERENTAARFG